MRRQTITTTLELTVDDREYLRQIAEEKQVSLSAVARWILAEYRTLARETATDSANGAPGQAIERPQRKAA
jgi:hypothetical protein